MIVKFDKEYLEELYTRGKCSDKKHRFQPQIIKAYIRRVITLAEAPNIESLYKLHSLNYEVLVGDKKGISSIRLDKQYRLEFIVSSDQSGEAILTICTLTYISNHYK